MKKKNIIKNFLQTLSVFALTLPSAVYAAFDWNVGLKGNGWSVGVGSSGSGLGGFGLNNNYGLPSGSILGIVQNILFWLLAAISLVAVIGFVISGLLYLTAAGDDTQIGRAKKAMTFSIIGIIVGLSGFVIMQAAFYMLSGQSF